MNCIVSGASSGIGREIVLSLLSKGHKVLAIARRDNLLGSLREEVSPSSHSLLVTLTADLSSESSIEEVKSSIESWERVDVLINNAGALINRPFKETTSEEFVDQYRSNVITAVNLTKATEPFLKRGSHVVNITSMGGFQGSSKYPGLSAYSSAKGALSVLTECLAEEYKTKGISINALALGAVETEMLKKAFPEYNPNMPPSKMAEFIVNFSLSSGAVMSGRILPVATANP